MAGRFSGLSVLALLALPVVPASAETPDREQIRSTVEAQHGATVKALQDWIALPTIAAEKQPE